MYRNYNKPYLETKHGWFVWSVWVVFWDIDDFSEMGHGAARKMWAWLKEMENLLLGMMKGLRKKQWSKAEISLFP